MGLNFRYFKYILTKKRIKCQNLQARALAPQLAETAKISFLIGTQSLKQTNNQIHLVEFNEEISTIKTSVMRIYFLFKTAL